MIEFEITESPDNNVIGNFKFFKNQIYIGSTSNDLSILDEQLGSQHILLEIPESELLIHPLEKNSAYLLNNKRSTAIRRLKKGDEILIGKTKIKIINFELTLKLSKKEILTNRMNELFETESSLLPIIEKLNQMMK
jgi:hypothetical protein